jgi:hypothetical protein
MPEGFWRTDEDQGEGDKGAVVFLDSLDLRK